MQVTEEKDVLRDEKDDATKIAKFLRNSRSGHTFATGLGPSEHRTLDDGAVSSVMGR